MRISDWSSDVCSSDLRRRPRIADGRPVTPSHPHAQAAPARQGRSPAATARSGPPVTCRNYFTSRQDRKSDVEGKSASVRVELGGRGIVRKTSSKAQYPTLQYTKVADGTKKHSK